MSGTFAAAISALPCGCYRRCGDSRWFYMPDCPHHGHLYPTGLSDSPILVPAGGSTRPSGVYR